MLHAVPWGHIKVLPFSITHHVWFRSQRSRCCSPQISGDSPPFGGCERGMTDMKRALCLFC